MVGIFKSLILLVCSTFLYEQPETNDIAGMPRYASSLKVLRPDRVITSPALQ